MDAPMVQIIENHAEISGELVSVAPDEQRPGFVVLSIKVSEARRLGSYANMFDRDVGQIVRVLARAESEAARSKAGPVTLKVKKTAPGVSFAE